MRSSTIALTLGLPVAVIAAPAATTTSPNNLYSAIHSAECKIVNVVVTALKQVSTASQFCSQYLKIQTVTSTATTTATDVVPASSTTYTSTSTLTINDISTTTTTSTFTTYTSTATDVVPASTTLPTSVVTVTACSGTLVVPSDPAPVKRDGLEILAERSSVATPTCLKGLAAAQISTVCLCLNIPTPTTTTTSIARTTSTSTTVFSLLASTSTTAITGTTTATSVTTLALDTTTTTTSTTTVTPVSTTTVESCPAPTACGNQGLEFAAYANINGANLQYNGRNPYDAFHPEDYKTQPTQCTGTTNSLGGFNYPENNNGLTVYGTCQLSKSDYFVLNHRGYIFAQQTGTYTFSVSDIDDIVEMWIGPKAYTGWTRSNADIDVAIFYTPSPFTFDMVAGRYYALRIIFGQAQGAATFQMTVEAPDGSTFLGPNTGASPYLVSYSCDQTTAPRYGPFGAET